MMYGFIIQSVVRGWEAHSSWSPETTCVFKDHLENGPGQLHARVPLVTSIYPDPRKHTDCPAHRHLQTDLTAGLFGWNHCLKCASVFQVSDRPYKSVAHSHNINFYNIVLPKVTIKCTRCVNRCLPKQSVIQRMNHGTGIYHIALNAGIVHQKIKIVSSLIHSHFV